MSTKSLLEQARELMAKMAEQIEAQERRNQPVRDGIYVNVPHGHIVRIDRGRAMVMDTVIKRMTDGGPAVLYENGVREGILRLVCDLKGNPVA